MSAPKSHAVGQQFARSMLRLAEQQLRTAKTDEERDFYEARAAFWREKLDHQPRQPELTLVAVNDPEENAA